MGKNKKNKKRNQKGPIMDELITENHDNITEESKKKLKIVKDLESMDELLRYLFIINLKENNHV
jgi:hypothetical protein